MILIENQAEKSNMLITAAHHSREFSSVSMIIKILIHKLHELIHRNSEVSFFDFSDILFVPFVNRDGYESITESFNTKDWNLAKLNRKNFNYTVVCQ